MKSSSLLLGLALAVASLNAAEPAQIALAHQAIKAAQFDKAFEQIRARVMMLSAQKLGVNPINPAAQDEATKATLAKISTIIDEHFTNLASKLDGVYAEIYTEKELQAQITFFESPEGKSFLSKQPMISQRLSPLAQSMQMELDAKINAVIAEAKTAAQPAPTPAGPTLLPPNAALPGPIPTPAPASTGPVPIPVPTPTPQK
jgi:hypothetical protein